MLLMFLIFVHVYISISIVISICYYYSYFHFYFYLTIMQNGVFFNNSHPDAGINSFQNMCSNNLDSTNNSQCRLSSEFWILEHAFGQTGHHMVQCSCIKNVQKSRHSLKTQCLIRNFKKHGNFNITGRHSVTAGLVISCFTSAYDVMLSMPLEEA